MTFMKGLLCLPILPPSAGKLLLTTALTLLAHGLAWADAPVADRYGDPLPLGALARLGTVRFRHTKTIWAMAYSPDGKILAAADGDGIAGHRGLSWHGPAEGTIRLWDPKTGKELRRLTGHDGIIRSLAFSADGKLLVSTSPENGLNRGRVNIWDVATGKRRELRDGIGSARCAALSPDGATLAVGCPGDIYFFDVASGKAVRKFPWADAIVKSVAFSPDGKTLGAVCQVSMENRGTRLWDVATGREIRKLPPESAGGTLAFSPDGKMLATRDYRQPVRLWDAETGQAVLTIGNGGDGWNFFAFSADGKALLIGADGDTVLWDITTKREVRRFGDKRGFYYAGAIAPDGKFLALSDDHAVRLFDINTGAELLPFTAHASPVDVATFSPDGNTLLTGGDGLQSWEPTSGKQLATLGPRATVGAAIYAPDGKAIIVGYHRAAAILIRDATTGQELRRFNGQPGEVELLAMLTGDKSVVSMSQRHMERLAVGDAMVQETNLHVWDIITGKESRQLGNHGGNPMELRALHRAACSADGRVLATGEQVTVDHQVWVWDAASGRTRVKLDHTDCVLALALTADGRRLVSAAFAPPSRFPVRLSEVATGAEIWRQVDTDYATLTLAVSPGGRVIASGGSDGAIRLWDLETRRELCKFVGHQGPILSVGFSGDGRRLVSGGRDTTALIWDLADLQPVTPAARLRTPELKELWTTLAAAEGAAALKAIRRLSVAPEQAVPFIAESLTTQPTADRERLARLLAELDADDFDKREAASAELSRMGKLAEAALKRALADKPSAEFRRRAEALLKVLDERLTPSELQAIRALEVLELIATPEAQKAIEALKKRSGSLRVSEEASVVLDRLAEHQGHR
jgi:WD40 repeat protein